jgi:hypothetical protein
MDTTRLFAESNWPGHFPSVYHKPTASRSAPCSNVAIAFTLTHKQRMKFQNYDHDWPQIPIFLGIFDVRPRKISEYWN